MILPVYAYGQPVLTKVAKDIENVDTDIIELIESMWETMYNAQGIGLAAPQIGKSIRLFVVDTVQMEEEGSDHKGIKEVFINAKMLDESGKPFDYEEGCLSIPHIRGNVSRQPDITIKYTNALGEELEQSFTGINARVIQHEYDHIEGKLFTEYLKPLRKRRIQRKLDAIKNGQVNASYRLKFVR